MHAVLTRYKEDFQKLGVSNPDKIYEQSMEENFLSGKSGIRPRKDKYYGYCEMPMHFKKKEKKNLDLTFGSVGISTLLPFFHRECVDFI